MVTTYNQVDNGNLHALQQSPIINQNDKHEVANLQNLNYNDSVILQERAKRSQTVD